MFKNQKGFTTLDLVVSLGMVCILVWGCVCVWVAYHFIAKAW